MSLNKAIENGKEHRRPYRRAKAIAKSCRNHGDCPWCMANRLHSQIQIEKRSAEMIKEYMKGER